MFQNKKKLSKKSLTLGYGYHSPAARRVPGTGFQRKAQKEKERKWTASIGKIFAFFKKFFSRTLIVTFIIAAIYWLYFSPFFKINTVAIEYEKGQPQAEDLKQYFQETIGKNIFKIDLDPITKKIITEHPELKTIKVTPYFPKKLVITFTRYKVVANIINLSKSGTQQFFINEAGIAVNKKDEKQNLPTIKIQTENPIDTTKTVISKEKIEYIIQSIQYFQEAINIKIAESLYITRARELHLKTEKNFMVWLDIEKPYQSQINKLKKSLTKFDIYKLPLEYIDLRISGITGEKIIFKRRK
jgi:hypothetical protein